MLNRAGPIVPRKSLIAGAVIATALALAPVNPAFAAEGEIRAAGADKVVPDSYIVVLNDGASTRATALTSRYGGTVGRTYRRALNGFEVAMPERAARRLAADPAVAYVQRNGIVNVTDTQTDPPSWGLDRIDRHRTALNKSYDYPTAAASVHAYVIDSGVRFSHVEFGGRAVSGVDAVDNDTDAADCNGHGTHVAGTLGGTNYGVAKGVQLVAVRVIGCSGSGTFATVIAGIEWVTENAVRPAVANLSIGTNGIDRAFDDAVANSIASGITYAVAAGNGLGDNVGVDACRVSPARLPTAITVGATNSKDVRAGFSNYGSCVDIFAPGDDIKSAYPVDDTTIAYMRGTSMASPHVAGAAAIVLAQHPEFTPQQVRDQLVERDPTVGALTNIGPSSPNKLLFVRNGPLRVDLSCSVPTGFWSCNAEAVGAVAPVTYTWSPNSSGACRTTRVVNVSVSVRDSLGATASNATTFTCRAICGNVARCKSEPGSDGTTLGATRSYRRSE